MSEAKKSWGQAHFGLAVGVFAVWFNFALLKDIFALGLVSATDKHGMLAFWALVLPVLFACQSCWLNYKRNRQDED